MSAIFTTFGIDWHLLLINAINFGLLLLGLWYFLYTPLMRMLEERRQKVAQGVADAQAAQQSLKEIEGTRASTLAQAGREADEVLARARNAAQAREREMLAHAEAAAASVVKEAEAQAKEAKARAVAESKQEVAKLIVLGMEKTMQTK
jgi:F-type H+-transporting ATPase subunit b